MARAWQEADSDKDQKDQRIKTQIALALNTSPQSMAATPSQPHASGQPSPEVGVSAPLGNSISLRSQDAGPCDSAGSLTPSSLEAARHADTQETQNEERAQGKN